MRRGYLRRYFDLGREAKGLADHLCGHAGLEEIVHPSGRVPGLSVIPAGRTPPNPAELLLRPAFADLLGVKAPAPMVPTADLFANVAKKDASGGISSKSPYAPVVAAQGQSAVQPVTQ